MELHIKTQAGDAMEIEQRYLDSINLDYNPNWNLVDAPWYAN